MTPGLNRKSGNEANLDSFQFLSIKHPTGTEATSFPLEAGGGGGFPTEFEDASTFAEYGLERREPRERDGSQLVVWPRGGG